MLLTLLLLFENACRVAHFDISTLLTVNCIVLLRIYAKSGRLATIDDRGRAAGSGRSGGAFGKNASRHGNGPWRTRSYRMVRYERSMVGLSREWIRKIVGRGGRNVGIVRVIVIVSREKKFEEVR